MFSRKMTIVTLSLSLNRALYTFLLSLLGESSNTSFSFFRLFFFSSFTENIKYKKMTKKEKEGEEQEEVKKSKRPEGIFLVIAH